mmetsp:Transcript_49437/g.112214  ORF Transcript_49437/g.112214 Transcript_49437/m.112214 type:complete len:113 (+) Transcript_49437:200-538(+)
MMLKTVVALKVQTRGSEKICREVEAAELPQALQFGEYLMWRFRTVALTVGLGAISRHFQQSLAPHLQAVLEDLQLLWRRLPPPTVATNSQVVLSGQHLAVQLRFHATTMSLS